MFLISFLAVANSLYGETPQKKFEQAIIVTKHDSSFSCFVEQNFYYEKIVLYKNNINDIQSKINISNIKSISFPSRYLENISLNNKEYLMDKIVNGKVKLFKYDHSIEGVKDYSRKYKVKQKNGYTIYNKDIHYNYIDDNTIFCVNKDGMFFEIPVDIDTKLLVELFPDCQHIVDSIKSGYYQQYNLEALVKSYNEFLNKDSLAVPIVIHDSIYSQADEMPKYIGGDSAFSMMLTENFNFPAFPNYKEYFVEYEIVVDKKGTILIAKKVKGDVYNEDNLKSIITKNNANWVPAKVNGKIVNSIINLKITLRLNQIFANIYSPHSANTDYQKGKLVDGYKSGIWEYFDIAEKLSLKINYDNGAVLYLQKDTSNYVVFDNDKWVSTRLNVHPRYIGSYKEFYKIFCQNFSYPEKLLKNKISGLTYLVFEIDSNGRCENIIVEDGPDQILIDEITKSFNAIPNLWLTATKGHMIYRSRFRLPIDLKIIIDDKEVLQKQITKSNIDEMQLAKNLAPVTIKAVGKKMPNNEILFFK